MTLDELNHLPPEAAARIFRNCCAAEPWVAGMVAGRPYRDLTEVLACSRALWPTLDESDWLQAFEAHPRIGDVDSLREKYASTKDLASAEQAGTRQADETVLRRLKEGNDRYFDTYGFIFIVCATGKSAADMLALLEQRLGTPREEEIRNAAREQIKITELRLEKQFMAPRSPITTHILDLGNGTPAAGVGVTLTGPDDTGAPSAVLAQGTTDADGRIGQWFEGPLKPGRYRLCFQTGAWFAARGQDTFFPEVNLDFQVTDSQAHYHVPLLLNQWGYSTYRGS